MKQIDCIAIDDEPLALEQMRNYISKVPYLNLLDTFTGGLDALSFIQGQNVDLIFLDIQMDDISGIQLLESLPYRPKVILTTAYGEFALKAYDLNVADYLLKPISFERFLKAVNHCCGDINKIRPAEKPTASLAEQDDYIFVRADQKIIKISFADILYVEGLKDYLRIVCRDRRIITHMSFSNLEKVLPGSNFIRVHKSFLISLSGIDSIGRNSVFIGDQSIPIGIYYKKAFFDLISSKGIL